MPEVSLSVPFERIGQRESRRSGPDCYRPECAKDGFLPKQKAVPHIISVLKNEPGRVRPGIAWRLKRALDGKKSTDFAIMPLV